MFTVMLAERKESFAFSMCTAKTRRYVNNCDFVYTFERGVARLQETKEMKLGVCPICSGKTARKRVDLTESVKGRLVVIKSVKAEVCSQCGERLYSQDEMQKIDAFLRKVKTGSVKPRSRKQVEVYSLGY